MLSTKVLLPIYMCFYKTYNIILLWIWSSFSNRLWNRNINLL